MCRMLYNAKSRFFGMRIFAMLASPVQLAHQCLNHARTSLKNGQKCTVTQPLHFGDADRKVAVVLSSKRVAGGIRGKVHHMVDHVQSGLCVCATPISTVPTDSNQPALSLHHTHYESRILQWALGQFRCMAVELHCCHQCNLIHVEPHGFDRIDLRIK
jgi:hypothetical protein